MAKGRSFLLKISDGETPPVYRTQGGFRIETETIESNSYVGTAAGIMLGSAAERRLRSEAMAGGLADYELSFESGEKLRGQMLLTRLDYIGDFNGESNYRVTLSGKVLTHDQ